MPNLHPKRHAKKGETVYKDEYHKLMFFEITKNLIDNTSMTVSRLMQKLREFINNEGSISEGQLLKTSNNLLVFSSIVKIVIICERNKSTGRNRSLHQVGINNAGSS